MRVVDNALSQAVDIYRKVFQMVEMAQEIDSIEILVPFYVPHYTVEHEALSNVFFGS